MRLGKKKCAMGGPINPIPYDQWKTQYGLQESPDYNLKRAWELGYTPDETGHLPSVDETNGEWLKSKNHPTAWKEYMYGALAPELADQTVVQNVNGNLQYVPKKMALGGNVNQDLNADTVRIQKKLAPDAATEGLLTAADILTGNVTQAFTGKSISGYGNVNQGKGSMFSQVEDTAHNVASGVIGSIFPVAKPFIEARKGIREGVAPATGGYSNDGGALLGDEGSAALSGAMSGLGNIGGMFGGMGGQPTSLGSGPVDPLQDTSTIKFAKGGKIPVDPNLPLQNIEGNKHEQGGTMIAPGVEAEKGETKMDDFVFSDRLKVPGTKRTFAQESKRMQNQYKLRPDDSMAQKQLDKELNGLATIQETYKGSMDGFMSSVQPLINGDRMSLQMADGGNWRRAARKQGIDPNDFQSFIEENYGEDWSDVKRIKDLKFYLDSYKQDMAMNQNPNYPYTQDVGPTSATGLPQVRQFDSNQQINPTALGSGPVDPTQVNQSMQRIPLNNALGVIGSSIGPLANFAAAAFAPDGRVNRHIDLRTTNTTPAEQIAKQQSNEAIAAGLYNFKNAPTAGSFLGNVATALPKINQQTGATLAGIRYQGDLQNNQILNQENMVNQQIDTANNLIKDQSTAQRWNLGLAGAENLGNNLVGIGRDVNANNMQNTILPFIETPNYGLDINRKGIRWKFKS